MVSLPVRAFAVSALQGAGRVAEQWLRVDRRLNEAARRNAAGAVAGGSAWAETGWFRYGNSFRADRPLRRVGDRRLR